MAQSKILILDIETAPHLAYVWGMWKQNIGLPQIEKRTYILSYAAKWLGNEDTMWATAQNEEAEKVLLTNLRDILNEADIVVTHNGKKFDIPVILGRMLVHNLTPPAPFHQVDTYQVAKGEFRLANNSLANIAEELNVRKKGKHKKFPGFELWTECLKGNVDAWKELVDYNIQDVLVLQDVYLRMRPYMRGHPNVVRFDEEIACAKCGSQHIQLRGYYTSAAGIPYHRFQCQGCGGWGRTRLMDREVKKPEGRNAR